MLEKIWHFAVLANLPSVATAYTGKLVFCLYVVYTSSLKENVLYWQTPSLFHPHTAASTLAFNIQQKFCLYIY